MKVGTDGVLLGSWTDTGGAKRILDIGCGSGLIALMMAQRSGEAHIVGIEIDEEAAEQARENVRQSRWSNRIEIKTSNFIEDFNSEEPFDLIVSNPPFYKETTQCPNDERDKARHSTALPLDSLIGRSTELLKEGGRLALILPSSSAAEAIGEAAMKGLYLLRRTDVRTTPKKAAKRTLLEFGRKPQPTEQTPLMLCDEKGERSLEYKILTEDFYL